MQFRNLAPEDKEQAVKIIEICFDSPVVTQEFLERFEAYLAPQKGAYVVRYVGLFKNGILAGIGGYAMSSMTYSCWELSWGAIAPKFRGIEIFRKSIEFTMAQILLRAKTEQVYVLTHARDAQFYKKLGFKKAFDANLDKPVLWKRLR